MSDKTYNGWTNYETWVVKLWLDNEEPTYRYWQEQADAAFAAAVDRVSPFTIDERAALALVDALKDEHEAALPDVTGFTADLLNAAMSEVNWYEIAVSLIDEAKERLPADGDTQPQERTP